jgi:two-component system, cell cycle response regulator
MKRELKDFWSSLWAPPDPVLAGAGAAGELLVAKIRVSLAVVLLAIPVADALIAPDAGQEAWVGFSLTVGTFLFSACAYFLIAREFNPPWLSFVTSAFDVTFVSVALAVFFLFDQPHTAVNSKVVFEGYFLAIGGTSLRYDRRVCLIAGLLTLIEYFAIVAYADARWDLNSNAYSPYPYGMFSWAAQSSRLILLLSAAVISFALVSRTQKLLRLATSDHLTGLLNRGYVEDRFAIELSRSRRYRQPLSLAVIDVDRFKSFNDSHGHAAGDFVLKAIASAFRQSFRQSDTVGRYGGEEFVVLMPETSIEAAQHKLDSLRQRIADEAISFALTGESFHVTISAGLAGYPHDGSTEEELFTIADERLFQAKREGRNRVVAAPEPVLV